MNFQSHKLSGFEMQIHLKNNSIYHLKKAPTHKDVSNSILKNGQQDLVLSFILITTNNKGFEEVSST